jgi:hypothetical protein
LCDDLADVGWFLSQEISARFDEFASTPETPERANGEKTIRVTSLDIVVSVADHDASPADGMFVKSPLKGCCLRLIHLIERRREYRLESSE